MLQQSQFIRQETLGSLPQPPHTNRGVEHSHLQDIVFSFDWLRLTVWAGFDTVRPLLSLLTVDIGLEETGHGGLGFKRVLGGLNGFQLYVEPVNEGLVYVSLNMPSKCLQAIGIDALRAGLNWLCEHGLSGLRWSCTRLDLAFDTQGFTVQQFADAYRSGQIATKTRKWNEIKGSDDSHTFYLGSRESSAMLRVYHKMDGSSFGAEAFTRVELELKEDRAALALSEIFAADMSEWAVMAAGWVVGFADVATDWWREWFAGVKRSWLRLRQNIPTVESIRQWLFKQVSTSLTTYVSAVAGADLDEMGTLLRELLLDGQSKLGKRHQAMIDRYSSDVSPEFAAFAF